MSKLKQKPKLLFIVHSLVMGGTEHLVLQMSKSLKERYEIAICCLDKQGELWKEAEAEGFKLLNLQRKPGLDLSIPLKLKNLISDFKPDMVHAMQYSPFFYSCLVKTLLFGKLKLIFTEHGRPYPDVVSAKRKFANFFLQFFINKLTVVCEFTKESMINVESFTKNNILVIYNGVPNVKLQNKKSIKEKLGLSEDSKVIAVVGSLREVKNPTFILNAFAKFKKSKIKKDNTYLVYIGDGHLRAQLEKEISKLKLNDEVILAGNIIPATDYFPSFDIFALVSQSEACSLAILESMVAEVPVIVSNRGGSPELVEDGVTGQVVEVGEVDNLSKAIEKGLARDSEIKEQVKKAKAVADKKFSFTEMLNSYEKVYQELLK